jgi:hypothetical protein
MFYLPPLSKNLKNENVTCCSVWFLNLFSLLREHHTQGIWEKGAEHHTFGWNYSEYQMDGQNQVTSSIIIFTLDEVLSRSRWPQGLRCDCGLSRGGTAGSNTSGGMNVCLLWMLCCQSEVSATGRSLVQRSPTEHACVRMCVCVCHCVWLGATITLYTYSEYTERGQYKKERLK